MKTYRETSGREQDFNVTYLLYPTKKDSGEVVRQHIRCDFAYDGDDISKTGIYMIYPEFLDSNGNPLDEGEEVPQEGKASMWILFDEMKEEVHRKRLKKGVKGYFMVGSRRIGEVVVDEIVGLHNESV